MARTSKTSYLEYIALRGCCALVNAIPYSIAMGLARFLGYIAFDVVRLHHKRTLARIKSVFPDKTNKEIRAIARSSITNVIMSGIEMIRAPKLNRAWMDKYVIDGKHYKDVLQELVNEGKGAVIMVPHSGNWYMAAWSMAKYGLPLFALAARQRNPYINEWMNRQYGDIEVLDRDNRGTLLQIKDYLEAGRAFAILPDLRVRNKDVEADFLGGKANVSHAGAMFAVKTNSPIVVAAMCRENGRHRLVHITTLRPENRTAEDLTKEVMKLLDGFIRQHPGDWYWYNKRWILEPV